MNRREFVKLGPAFPVAAVTATLTLKEEGKLPIEGLDLSVLKLHPGDFVVLKCDGYISVEHAAQIKAMWSDAVPNTKAIILMGGMTIEGVLRA